MSSPTAILLQPTYQFSPSSCSQLKSVKPFSFLGSNSISSAGFVFGRAAVPVSERTRLFWSSHTMAESSVVSIKASAFRSGDGDEGPVVLEQEALIDGSSSSSDFRARFLAGGLESTLNRLSKWLVAGLFGAVVLCRHDPEAVWFAAGSIVNAVVSVKLKRILNQERPISTLRSDPGMPSSHAQSIFFIFTFASISFLEWLGINEITLLTSGSALAFASYLSWLRVSQQLHTISQVVVGAALGSSFSILWYWSWKAIVLEAFDSFLWVQILVILGAAGLGIGFLVYVIRNWFRDDR